jgi:hypothetical protein
MAPNQAPQFETDDAVGSTDTFTGSVGSTPISVPASAGGDIALVSVKQPMGVPPYNKILYFSLDGGTNWHVLQQGEGAIWPLRGAIKQIQIKGNVAGVAYEVILNRETP